MCQNRNSTKYNEFLRRFKTIVAQRPDLVKTVLSNIFSMRSVGNKIHGDLAEIAIAEFINQYMPGYRSEHVGKQKYRAKECEEDIRVFNERRKESFLISVKAYGHGPIQLSTDKEFRMFPRLVKVFGNRKKIEGRKKIIGILDGEGFCGLNCLNVLPLIYDEKNRRCNIMIFDFDKAKKETCVIKLEADGNRRKYPVFRFYDANGGYVCEVRYGGKDANALQRGFWTHTKHGEKYFDSLTDGWVDYDDNRSIVSLFRFALISSRIWQDKSMAMLANYIEESKGG